MVAVATTVDRVRRHTKSPTTPVLTAFPEPPLRARLVESIRPVVGVAQLVELLVVVQAVVGSSPIAHPS